MGDGISEDGGDAGIGVLGVAAKGGEFADVVEEGEVFGLAEEIDELADGEVVVECDDAELVAGFEEVGDEGVVEGRVGWRWSERSGGLGPLTS